MTATGDTLRDRLLDAFLTHVAFDGWTDTALAAAAKDCGQSVEMAKNAYPGGLLELASAFSGRTDRDMAARLAAMDMNDVRIRDRIALGVRTRLEILAPHREAVRHLSGFLALPGQHGTAARCVWKTASEIWYAAGDTSTDFNHYTKRGLLAPVITATVLYWLADESEGFADTWGFLDRRIDDVLAVTALKGKLEKKLKGFSPERFFRSRSRGGFGGFGGGLAGFRARATRGGFTRRTGRTF